MPIHNIQNEGSQDVESLTVSHHFVPARIRQKNTFEHRAILFIVRAAETTTARSVQVLKCSRRWKQGLFA